MGDYLDMPELYMIQLCISKKGGAKMSKLASLRRERGFTQRDMAKETGISQPIISMIESRRFVASDYYTEKIAQGYGFVGKEKEFFDPKTGLAI